MLDFGFPELLLICAVLILVIGPKQIPEIMYNLGRIMRRLNYMRFALSRQFEDFMHDMDVEKQGTDKTDSLGLLPNEKHHYESSPEYEEDEDFDVPDPEAEYPEAKPYDEQEQK